MDLERLLHKLDVDAQHLIDPAPMTPGEPQAPNTAFRLGWALHSLDEARRVLRGALTDRQVPDGDGGPCGATPQHAHSCAIDQPHERKHECACGYVWSDP